ncbi:MAG: fibronectin type III domain-containing protein, partial [Dehalococcoidia bacterium]|nr:fibronectin type III domain-containing protein [Dehalococcoidia bacterium]
GAVPPRPITNGSGGNKGMLVLLLVLLIGGLGGFGYWAYSQGYLKSLPFMGSGNVTSQKGPTYTAPPEITEVQVSAKAMKEVGIVWNTDQPSSSQVEWGESTSYGNLTEVTDDPSTGNSMGLVTHGVTVKGLTANTTYHYRVISKNKDGLSSTSEDNTFTTPEE